MSAISRCGTSRFTLCAGAVLLPFAVPAIFAQAGPAEDAKEILARTAATYRSMQSCHFEATTVSETQAEKQVSRSSTTVEIAMAQPAKIRVEYKYPNGGSWLRVSDGRTFSQYRTMTKELEQRAATDDDQRVLHATMLARFQDLDQKVSSARVVRKESVTANGRNNDCYVVEAVYAPAVLPDGAEPLPTLFWIDQKSSLVLELVTGSKSKKTENTRTTTFSVALVNGAVPDDLFAFHAKGRSK